MPRKLKVYCTPIGFHDAYVAAPNQKEALTAWGADANLFARGVAELVTDPDLTAEPLAKPGVVVKRLRGTAAEHIAALPKKKPKPSPSPQSTRKTETKPTKRAPRPNRAQLDAAERAIEHAEARQRREEQALKQEEAQLARRRRDLARQQETEIAKLERVRDRAAAAYEAAAVKWRG